MSDIIKCSCKHEFQDSMYGKGNRVSTPMKNGQLRCTVCGTLHGTASITKAKPTVKITTEPTDAKVEVKKDEKKDVDVKKDDKKKSLKGGKR